MLAKRGERPILLDMESSVFNLASFLLNAVIELVFFFVVVLWGEETDSNISHPPFGPGR